MFSKETTLLTIGDDCLHEICSNLNLQDHLNLAEVCQQLKYFVQRQLQTANALSKKLNQVEKAEKTAKMPKLLSSLCLNSLSELNCEASKLLWIKDLKFYATTSLNIFGAELERSQQEDFEQLIANSFPKLQKFHSTAQFSEFVLNENSPFHAYVESIQINVALAFEDFSKDTIRNGMATLRNMVRADDYIATLRQLYETYPTAWKKLERVFHLKDAQVVNEKILKDKAFEIVEFMGQNEKKLTPLPLWHSSQRFGFGVKSQIQQKRFMFCCANVHPKAIKARPNFEMSFTFQTKA